MGSGSSNVRRSIAALFALSLVAAAAPAAASGGSTVGTGKVKCSGEPVTYAVIAPDTGPTALPDVRDAAEAGIKAANKTCEAGVPMKLFFCDEKTDPNAARDCAREAVESGAIAAFYYGSFAGNVTPVLSEANIPEWGTPAQSAEALFGPDAQNVFSFWPGPGLLPGIVATIAGTGAESFHVVTLEIPQQALFNDLYESFGGEFDVEYKGLTGVPVDAIDMTQYAAQALDSGADGFSTAVGDVQMEGLLKAIQQSGTTLDEVTVITGAVAVQNTVENLGKDADGLYLIASTSIGDKKNPGTKRFRSELKAAGKSTNAGDVALIVNAAIHELATIVKGLPAGTVDGPAVKQAARGWKVERPELPLIDFSTPATILEGTALAAAPLYQTEMAVVRIKNGKLVEVSDGFVPLNEVPELAK